jgi:hypothetical protein
VANNPTIFAIREAQLLWPDTKIDCLVSIGCGSVPTKVNNLCFKSNNILHLEKKIKDFGSYSGAHFLLHFLKHENEKECDC